MCPLSLRKPEVSQFLVSRFRTLDGREPVLRLEYNLQWVSPVFDKHIEVNPIIITESGNCPT